MANKNKKYKRSIESAGRINTSFNYTNSNVDTRSDTTRKGYHEGKMSSVQSHSYHPFIDMYNAVDYYTNATNPNSPRYNPNLVIGIAPNPGLTKSANTIRLYRATGTSGNFKPSLDGLKEFSGKWFTSNPNKPQRYASMTVKRAKQKGINNPIELQYVDIPSNDINKYKASEILKGRKDVEYEPLEDYLIPLDYPRQRIPLEGYTGNILLDSRKKLPIQFKNGGIHIAPFKRGTFTAAATKHGMGVQEFASRVLRNKDSYSPAMVKKANFARNANKWNK